MKEFKEANEEDEDSDSVSSGTRYVKQ